MSRKPNGPIGKEGDSFDDIMRQILSVRIPSKKRSKTPKKETPSDKVETTKEKES